MFYFVFFLFFQQGTNSLTIKLDFRKKAKKKLLKYSSDIQVVVEEKMSTSPKLERPRSLSIQQNEGNNEDEANDVKCEEELDEEIVRIEANMERIHFGHDEKGAKDVEHLSEPDKAAGKKTPSHLTEQGFFDLKFYHNKLW